MRRVGNIVRESKGATAVEYGLLCGLIGLAIVGALSNITVGLGVTFARIGSALTP